VNRVGIGIFAVASLLIGAACDSTHDATPRSTGAPKQAKERGGFDPAVPSRDGKRIAVVRHAGNVSYLEVGPAGEGSRRRVIFHARGCCSDLAWASRSVIAFVEGYDAEVETIDVKTRRVRRLAGP
jgi:hypothetical protein